MRTLLVSCLFSLGLCHGGASAAPSYQITDLGLLPGYSQSFSYAISDNGQFVAGWLQQGSTTRAFRWSASTGMELLALDAGASASRAFGVNDSGVVAGEQVFSATRRGATLWAGAGTALGLGTLANPAAQDFSSVAFGVNNAGTAAGWSDSVDSTRAFTWTAATGMASLGTLAGGSQTRAYSINASGEVVGWGTSPAGDRGFVANPVPTGVGALSADAGSRTRAFGSSNLNGWVTGDARDPASGDTAFVWSPTTALTPLGLLAGTSRSFGADVNSSGTAVGWTDGGAAGERAFLWTAADGMLDLNALLTNGAAWQLQRARSINDQGLVVANAVDSSGLVHAVLLSPVPEPATAALLLAGLAAAGLLRGRAHGQAGPLAGPR